MPKAANSVHTEKKRESTEDNSMKVSGHKKSLSSVVARNSQLETQLKRALADYQNLEKRIEEERKLLSRLSASLLIEKLLPVLDNLENAQAYLKDEGLEMVIKQFKEIFTQEGVEEIAATGVQFDPHFHEAIETQEGEKDNMIIKVVSKGYKIEDTVLRPAKVIVTKKKVDKEAEQKAEKASAFGDYA